MERQALSILVENTPNVLSHVSGLFSRRGYNIDSISAGVTADPRFTRITIVSSGDELILEHIHSLELYRLDPRAGFSILLYRRSLKAGFSILFHFHTGRFCRQLRRFLPP